MVSLTPWHCPWHCLTARCFLSPKTFLFTPGHHFLALGHCPCGPGTRTLPSCSTRLIFAGVPDMGAEPPAWEARVQGTVMRLISAHRGTVRELGLRAQSCSARQGTGGKLGKFGFPAQSCVRSRAPSRKLGRPHASGEPHISLGRDTHLRGEVHQHCTLWGGGWLVMLQARQASMVCFWWIGGLGCKDSHMRFVA